MKKVYILLFVLMGTGVLFAQTEVTFRVDMSVTAADAAGVFMSGNWMAAAGLGDDWQEPGTNDMAKLTDDGDDVYSLTVMLPAGDYQFKFANGATWPNAEAGGSGDNYQADLSGCGGVDNGFGGYNRTVTIPDQAAYSPTNYLFNSCDVSAVSTNELTTLSGVKMSPNPASSNVLITFENTNNANHLISVYTLTGQLVNSVDLGTGTFLNLNVADLAKGMYIVAFRNELGEIGSQKLVVR